MSLDVRKSCYPEIEPYKTGSLEVSPIHTLYYEECGNKNGKPVVILHGGPGAGCNAQMRRYHDPKKYRIILFDQRGCGRSTPHAELKENTTWDLVEDIEKLRKKLSITKWQVFGGSWGSTLALAYAQTYPEIVSELILRGIFTLTQREIRWFYQDGCNLLFPDLWENYIRPIPMEERGDMIKAYYKRLTGDNKKVMYDCAKAWSGWEGSTITLYSNQEIIGRFMEEKFALSMARIECHYFINGGFFSEDGHLIKNASVLNNIPGVIVHGRYDVITPIETAWKLHKKWKESNLHIIPDAGHAVSEPGITDKLISATLKYS